MADNKKESAAERIARMKKEKEESRPTQTETADLVNQLTHHDDGEPDFTEIAKKLQERKKQEAKGENEGYVKMTIYVEENVAEAFNALITKRGQQKEFVNIALKDFIQKKVRELDLDK